MQWVIRLCLAIVAFVCAGLAGGFAFEQIAERIDAHRYPAPGVMVDVGGHRINLYCEGVGAPTVVMEMGAAEPAMLFRPVQDGVAAFTRACVYDRPGLGWSESAPVGRSIEQRAAELDTLLKNAHISGPYVLVAHSYGGLISRTFTRDHSQDVRGMVLVDTAPEEYAFSNGFLDAVRNGLPERRKSELTAQFGILRLRLLSSPGQFGIRNDLFPNVRGELIAFYSSPKFVRANADEARSYSLVPPAMRGPDGFGNLGSLPLIVIRHGRPSESIFIPPGMSQEQFERFWAESQERLAGLSTNSILINAAHSSHLINIDQPELIVQATERVVTAVRDDVSLDQVK